ncbi:NUDIX domain-containing protein [Rhizobium sp. RU35A]|uniref:NUDIX hydrolase n=1 Tax=Rhizobium sp. RU35A TaxID=1907414 RepID=UPI000955C81B|nr:NUDIX hydrolase [Rhizobium sp. RU35A]SIP90761.1 NUDIX domain-containing protein [Rhizobium sp. RU35A]
MDKNGPLEKNWTVLRSERVLKDRWIDLRADHCQTPSGREISPYYVLSYADWVNIVAITEADEVVMVRQYRHGVAAWVTELPGGVADPEDRSLAEAAARELLEETGYRVAAVPEPVSSLYANPATNTNRVHTFLARGVTFDRAPNQEAGEEGMSVHLAPVAEVVAGLRSGGILQSMHVAALSLALMATGHIRT